MPPSCLMRARSAKHAVDLYDELAQDHTHMPSGAQSLRAPRHVWQVNVLHVVHVPAQFQHGERAAKEDLQVQMYHAYIISRSRV